MEPLKKAAQGCYCCVYLAARVSQQQDKRKPLFIMRFQNLFILLYLLIPDTILCVVICFQVRLLWTAVGSPVCYSKNFPFLFKITSEIKSNRLNQKTPSKLTTCLIIVHRGGCTPLPILSSIEYSYLVYTRRRDPMASAFKRAAPATDQLGVHEEVPVEI